MNDINVSQFTQVFESLSENETDPIIGLYPQWSCGPKKLKITSTQLNFTLLHKSHIEKVITKISK